MSRLARLLGWLICLAGVGVLIGGCRRSEPVAGGPDEAAGPKAGQSQQPANPPSAREVLERMAQEYKKAASYADFGTLHLEAQTTGGPVD